MTDTGSMTVTDQCRSQQVQQNSSVYGVLLAEVLQELCGKQEDTGGWNVENGFQGCPILGMKKRW